MVIGPREHVVKTLTCTGCPSLSTKEWSEEIENDSGTSARCDSNGRHITSYWYDNYRHPSWCPALDQSEKE